jgi:hypothetical protein
MIVLLPTLGWVWPALAPLVGSVAAALGYREFADPKGILRGRTTRLLERMRLERVALDEVLANVIAEELGNEERLIFERDEMILVFRKDARGKFFVDVLGPREKSALDLKIRAEEFAAELIKKFAYNRLASQLTRTGAVIVSEEVAESGRITLTARRWN